MAGGRASRCRGWHVLEARWQTRPSFTGVTRGKGKELGPRARRQPRPPPVATLSRRALWAPAPLATPRWLSLQPARACLRWRQHLLHRRVAPAPRPPPQLARPLAEAWRAAWGWSRAAWGWSRADLREHVPTRARTATRRRAAARQPFAMPASPSPKKKRQEWRECVSMCGREGGQPAHGVALRH